MKMAKALNLVKSDSITVELDTYRLEELAEAAIERLVSQKLDAANLGRHSRTALGRF